MTDKTILEVVYALGRKKMVFSKLSTGKECVDVIAKKLKLAHPNLDVGECAVFIPAHGALRDGVWLAPTASLSAPSNGVDDLLEIEFRRRPASVDVLVAERGVTLAVELDFAHTIGAVLRKLLARAELSDARAQQMLLFTAPRGDTERTQPLDSNGTLGAQLRPGELLVLKRPKTGVVNKLLGTVRRSVAVDDDVGGSSSSSSSSSSSNTASTTTSSGSGSGSGSIGGGGSGVAGGIGSDGSDSTSSMSMAAASVRSGDVDEAHLPVFGVPLEVVVRRVGGLPAVVRHTVAFIEKFGLDQEGIFRLSGSAARIEEMRARIDRGQEVRFEPTSNVHDATGLLKRYLRELPEGVLTERLYAYFLSAAKCESATSRLHFLRALLRALPRGHAMLAEFLLRHLARVIARQESNKMHANNVATIFGPLLLRAAAEHRQIAHTGLVNEATKELVDQVPALYESRSAVPFSAAGVAEHTHVPSAENSEEMSFTAGDVLFFTARDASDWWNGVAPDGRNGLVPINFVKLEIDFDELNAARADAAHLSASASASTTTGGEGASAMTSDGGDVQRAVEARLAREAAALQPATGSASALKHAPDHLKIVGGSSSAETIDTSAAMEKIIALQHAQRETLRVRELQATVRWQSREAGALSARGLSTASDSDVIAISAPLRVTHNTDAVAELRALADAAGISPRAQLARQQSSPSLSARRTASANATLQPHEGDDMAAREPKLAISAIVATTSTAAAALAAVKPPLPTSPPPAALTWQRPSASKAVGGVRTGIEREDKPRRSSSSGKIRTRDRARTSAVPAAVDMTATTAPAAPATPTTTNNDGERSSSAERRRAALNRSAELTPGTDAVEKAILDAEQLMAALQAAK